MLKSLLLLFRRSFKTRTQLILENIFLHKQLEIYQRTDPKLKIKGTDRMIFRIIEEYLSNWRKRLFIVKPDSVIKWLSLVKIPSTLKIEDVFEEPEAGNLHVWFCGGGVVNWDNSSQVTGPYWSRLCYISLWIRI
jgi:hypothetical protein